MNILSNEERAELRRFLIERFNLSELKDLAFDLGVGYELFKHDTLPDFARELLLFCERQGQISCLLNEIRVLRPDNEQQIVTWLAKMPPCDARQKIQVIAAETLLDKVQMLVEALAQELGLPAEAISIVGAAWGSARLLLSVPTGAMNFTRFKEIATLANGRFHILSIEAFIFLPASAQAAWRLVATTHPPVEVDGALLSTISWQAIQTPAEPQAPVNDSPSDHWLSRANNQTQLLAISRELVSKLSPGETERLESLFPQYTDLAQIGQVKTVQQAQQAFALGGETASLALVVLSVVFTAVNTWLIQQNRQTLAQVKLRQESDRAQLDLVVEDALKKNQISRQQRDKLRPYLTEAIAKEIGDPYSPYEMGLEKLAQQLGPVLELLTYEQQLLENISQTRRHGETRDRASRRSEIIEQLNRFSLRETNQTFNDLCEINRVKPESLPEPIRSNPAVTAKEMKTQLKDGSKKNRFGHGWSSLRRLFTRKSATKTIEPVYVSAQHSAFIESIAQLIVTRVAPEELPVFEKLTAIYFADPTPPDLTAVPQYDPLSMGLGEVLVAVTPAATAVVVLALTYLSRHRPASEAEWEAQQAALHQSFNYEIGLQHLLNRIPEQHPKHSELLVFQVRLTENMAQQRLYGDTAELRHSRFQIIEQLNRLTLEAVGESFNALSGMASGISQVRWQELRQQGFQVAQEFGMTEEAAEQISTTMMSAFLTTLWSKSHG